MPPSGGVPYPLWCKGNLPSCCIDTTPYPRCSHATLRPRITDLPHGLCLPSTTFRQHNTNVLLHREHRPMLHYRSRPMLHRRYDTCCVAAQISGIYLWGIRYGWRGIDTCELIQTYEFRGDRQVSAGIQAAKIHNLGRSSLSTHPRRILSRIAHTLVFLPFSSAMPICRPCTHPLRHGTYSETPVRTCCIFASPSDLPRWNLPIQAKLYFWLRSPSFLF